MNLIECNCSALEADLILIKLPRLTPLLCNPVCLKRTKREQTWSLQDTATFGFRRVTNARKQPRRLPDCDRLCLIARSSRRIWFLCRGGKRKMDSTVGLTSCREAKVFSSVATRPFGIRAKIWKRWTDGCGLWSRG